MARPGGGRRLGASDAAPRAAARDLARARRRARPATPRGCARHLERAVAAGRPSTGPPAGAVRGARAAGARGGATRRRAGRRRAAGRSPSARRVEAAELAAALPGHPPWGAAGRRGAARGSRSPAGDAERRRARARGRRRRCRRRCTRTCTSTSCCRSLRSLDGGGRARVGGGVRPYLQLDARDGRAADDGRGRAGPLVPRTDRARAGARSPGRSTTLAWRRRPRADGAADGRRRAAAAAWCRARRTPRSPRSSGIDEQAVARRLGELFARIGASSRAEATAFAFRERVL